MYSKFVVVLFFVTLLMRGKHHYVGKKAEKLLGILAFGFAFTFQNGSAIIRICVW